MSRVETKKLGGTKEILFHADFTAVPVMVEGEGIVKAGTIVGGKVLSESGTVKAANTEDAEGVLMHDVDASNGPREGSMVIRGDINLSKLPEKPTAEAKAALATRILFISK